ncbi:MAG: BlaI/MecI/CopY family transcriptional regulator [Clostridiaceae bacterium]|nr:BlaI/MecI/CopY family transcriptional regulator [Clostridiaceae bacterium]MCI9483833.1 BlaI/MecI/CopY family transcriptional regulator [Clostridiaceae bacterium]
MKREPIRKGEKQLMEIFWEVGEPLTSLELIERVGGSMSVGSIHRLLQKLEAGGYISMCGVERTQKHLIRQFAPLVSKEEYLSSLIESEDLSDFSVAQIGLSLVRHGKKEQTEEQRQKMIAELEAMIEEYKNREE